MIDLKRVKPKQKISIVQNNKYPNQAVMTTSPVIDGKRPTLKLNRKAMELLGVTEDNNRLILFPAYDISSNEESEPEYDTVIGVVGENTIKIGSKQQKTYQIHLNTRCVKSTFIHNEVCKLFNLTPNKSYDFEIFPCTDVSGVYTLDYIENSNDDVTTEVEVEFDKGEEVTIKEA